MSTNLYRKIWSKVLVGIVTVIMIPSVVFGNTIEVIEVKNEAFFRIKEEGQWQRLQVGQVLFPYNEVKTLANTQVTLQMADASEIRVAPNAYLRINPQTTLSERQFDLNLVFGKAWAILRKNVRRNTQLILRTANAKIGVKGTSYEIVANDHQTRVRVFSGEVEVHSKEKEFVASMSENLATGGLQEVAPPAEVSVEEWHVIVASFQEVIVVGNQAPTTPIAFQLTEIEDEWVNWNLEKDQTFLK